MAMSEGGGPVEKMVQVRESDWADIQKTLQWIHDNPGVHRENMRVEIERLHAKHCR